MCCVRFFLRWNSWSLFENFAVKVKKRSLDKKGNQHRTEVNKWKTHVDQILRNLADKVLSRTERKYARLVRFQEVIFTWHSSEVDFSLGLLLQPPPQHFSFSFPHSPFSGFFSPALFELEPNEGTWKPQYRCATKADAIASPTRSNDVRGSNMLGVSPNPIPTLFTVDLGLANIVYVYMNLASWECP